MHERERILYLKRHRASLFFFSFFFPFFIICCVLIVLIVVFNLAVIVIFVAAGVCVFLCLFWLGARGGVGGGGGGSYSLRYNLVLSLLDFCRSCRGVLAQSVKPITSHQEVTGPLPVVVPRSLLVESVSF